MIQQHKNRSRGTRYLAAGAWALSGQIAITLASLVIYGLIGRMLRPSDVGAYFLAQSLMIVTSRLGILGMNKSVVRLLAESQAMRQPRRAESVIRKAYLVASISTVVLLLAGPPIFHLMAKYVAKSEALSGIAWFVAIWSAARLNQRLLIETLRGFKDIRLASIFKSLSLVLYMAAIIGLWLTDQGTLMTVLAAAIASILVNCALGGLFVRSKLAKLRHQGAEGEQGEQLVAISTLLGVGLPLVANDTLVNMMRNSSIWIIGAFATPLDVALYGAASRLTRLAGQLLNLRPMILMPFIASKHALNELKSLEKLLRSAATIIGLPVAIVLLGLAVYGQQVLILIFGEQYGPAAPVLAILSVGLLARAVCGATDSALAMTGNQRVLMVITLICSVASVAAAVAVAGPFGPIAVALCASAGTILRQFVLLFFVKVKLGIWSHITCNCRPIWNAVRKKEPRSI